MALNCQIILDSTCRTSLQAVVIHAYDNSMTTGADIKCAVRLVEKQYPECNLPKSIVFNLKGKTPKVFEITASGKFCAYLLWKGQLSDDDCVEVPKESCSCLLESGDVVSLTEVLNVQEAIEIYASPLKSSDWDILSCQPNVIEDIFLSQVPLVHIKQEIRLTISPSLSTSLRVTKILSKQRELIVGLLNTNTNVFVAPLPSKLLNSAQPIVTDRKRRDRRPNTVFLRVLPENLRPLMTETNISLPYSLEACLVHPSVFVPSFYPNCECPTSIICRIEVPGKDSVAFVEIQDFVSIGPGDIYLPIACRKVLLAEDYDIISVEILLDSMRVSNLNRCTIRLHPVEWLSDEVEQDVQALSEKAKNFLLNKERALCSFQSSMLRKWDAKCIASRKGSPPSIVIFNRSILTVDINICSSEETLSTMCPSIIARIDFSVSIATSDHSRSFNAYLHLKSALDVEEFLGLVSMGELQQRHISMKILMTLSGVLTPLRLDPLSFKNRNLIGIDNLSADILLDLAPVSSEESICHKIMRSDSLLVTGPTFSGKTAILSAVLATIRYSVDIPVYVEYVDCSSLGIDGDILRNLGKYEALISDLYQCFVKVRIRSPSILFLDKIDNLLPTQEAEIIGRSTRAFSLQSVILTHLVRLLRCQRERESCLQERKACGNDSKIAYRSVNLTGTALSLRSLHSCLFQFGYFSGSYDVETLQSLGRLHLLNRSVRALGFNLNEDEVSDNIIKVTHNMPAGDIISLAKSAVSCASKRLSALGMKVRIVSLSDIIGAGTLYGMTVKAKTKISEYPTERWEDLVGLRQAKDELLNIFKYPFVFKDLYVSSPVRLSRSALLYGPPGCGKSALAFAIATECELPIVCVRGPELLDKYMGASEKAVRAAFDEAKALGKESPANACLLFFDELEAIGARRGRDNTGVTDRVVNQLLTLLDGVESDYLVGNSASRSDVYILAATSRPDLIDPALLRPGRIDKHVYVGLPESFSERIEIMTRSVNVRQSPTVSLTESSSLQEVIKRLAADAKASIMTAADLSAISDIAHTESVRESLVNNEAPIAIRVHHFLSAFHIIKPSLSLSDIEFYNSVCMRLMSHT